MKTLKDNLKSFVNIKNTNKQKVKFQKQKYKTYSII